MTRATHIITKYRDANGDIRWRAQTRNGRIVASSAGDGYKRKATMTRVMVDLFNAISLGTYEIRDET